MARDDLPRLDRWLREPHVAQWWRGEPADLAAVEAKYGPCVDGDDPTELFVIEDAAGPVGMIQRYLFSDEPEWATVLGEIVEVTDAAGIDYLIGDPAAIGRGVGSAAVAAIVPMVFDWRPVRSIVVTVQQANTASWRVLDKAGFRRVWNGVLDSPDPSDEGPEYVYTLSRIHPVANAIGCSPWLPTTHSRMYSRQTLGSRRATASPRCPARPRRVSPS
jgi:aminoglycoside 6'-N-acetyltransferase